MTAYPDYAAAEAAAYALLLEARPALPIRPLALLKTSSLLLTYNEAAARLEMSEEAFERCYGMADAFTIRQGGEVLVCYRADGNPARLNYTLSHELGHIRLRHGGSGPAQEREADHFASCLLCPEPVRQRLLRRPELSAEDAAKFCFLSISAIQAAMRRRPTQAPPELLAAVDALFAAQVEALKPSEIKGFRHPLKKIEKNVEKS